MLWQLFQAIDNVPDPAEAIRLAGQHEVKFLPPPGLTGHRPRFTCSRANPAIEA